MNGARLEIMRHLDGFIAGELPTLLRDPEESWQPSDFLPELDAENSFEEVRALQEEARALSDDAMVVLVGDMITEEALPTYASWISTLEGVGVQGEASTAWGAWNRGWCAEENRHGDLLNRYLYLSGRVNMREIEITVHHLINDGGDTEAGADPYRTFVYTSFQEIATRISHINLGNIARAAGADRLFKISQQVAGDEHRHARAFKLFVSKFIELDTNEALLAFQDMMKKKITMPARYMREKGKEIGSTFKKFEVVAGRSGVYTAMDYVNIIEHLVQAWDVEHLGALSPAAEKAQEYLCSLPERYRKVIERFRKTEETEPCTFRWLNTQEFKASLSNPA